MIKKTVKILTESPSKRHWNQVLVAEPTVEDACSYRAGEAIDSIRLMVFVAKVRTEVRF
jgi:aryl carrier-like protein